MKLLYLHLCPLTQKPANVIQVLHMCCAFQQIGVDLTLAVPKGNCRLQDIERDMGEFIKFKIYEYAKYSVKGRPMLWGAYFGIRSILAKAKSYDYCYVRDPFLARLAIQAGLKVIYESHAEKLHPLGLLHRWYLKKFLKTVNSPSLVKIIAISQALADIWIARGVPLEKIVVLHDGVAADDYKTVKSREQARLDLGIKTKAKIVMYVGSLYKDRGIDRILTLAASFPEAVFMVVGGPDKYKVIYQAKTEKLKLSNLVFVGRVPHSRVRDYLFAADVLLMLWSFKVPTIRVCSPLKMFEYMAAERIIVGQSFPTIKEILKDSETAFLADPDSDKELLEKLGQALSLGYPNDIAKEARSCVLNNYTWEKRARTIFGMLGLK